MISDEFWAPWYQYVTCPTVLRELWLFEKWLCLPNLLKTCWRRLWTTCMDHMLFMRSILVLVVLRRWCSFPVCVPVPVFIGNSWGAVTRWVPECVGIISYLILLWMSSHNGFRSAPFPAAPLSSQFSTTLCTLYEMNQLGSACLRSVRHHKTDQSPPLFVTVKDLDFKQHFLTS